MFRRVVGIAFSLVGLRLLQPLSDRFDEDALARHALKWLPAGLLLAYSRLVEGRELESVGIRWDGLGPYLRRVVVGTVVLLGANLVLQPLQERLPGSDTFEAELAQFTAFSLPERVFIAVTAGVTEELLFRGYATERLEELTGSRLAAAGIPTAVFVVLHRGEQWSWTSVARMAQPAVITAGLYLRFRDLLALATIHALNDIVGLVFAERFTDQSAGESATHSD